uniref:Isoform 2 of Orofacial cleft 1 candidate gene 1 protein n=1 Tax=Homo sapiens TaxID=9606 RepID=Q8IZS5-2
MWITSLITMKDEDIFDLAGDPQDSLIPGPSPTPKQNPVCNEAFFGHQTFSLRETGLKSVHCQGQEAENMEREKFQQKALKQTKQKKSKSAEFLMVKEDREATEGTGNPAFNMSSPDLSACQTAEKKVIRHDMPDRTLAAHQQKFRLPASAEPKGNEYGRNYFDPLMDEEINPRQCATEVSREDESGREETLNSEAPGSSNKSHEIHKEASEATTAHLEEFQRSQKTIILLGSSPLEQEIRSTSLHCMEDEMSHPWILLLKVTAVIRSRRYYREQRF